jgi:uncharacterized protein
LLIKKTLGIIKVIVNGQIKKILWRLPLYLEERKWGYYMDFRNIIRNIPEKYNLQCAGIFGSRSRGDYREDSDYDIFVMGDLTLDDELNLESELENLLNASVDVIKISENTDKLLLKNILNDAEIIYNKNNSFEDLYKFIEAFFIENSDFIRIREADLLG